jgi:hypothetical protein
MLGGRQGFPANRTMSRIASHSPSGNQLTSYYWSGDAIRSRSVSDIVLWGRVDVPEPPARLRADWARELSSHVSLEAGDVEAMPLARARARWPDYARCVQAVSAWVDGLGMPGLLASGDVALMACRGARYHNDGEQYGGAAFCNLFLTDDNDQQVHFPALDLRIPLTRGTVLIFDTCQPHGVTRRGSAGFEAADFPADRDCTQLFLTWELPIEDARLGQALHIDFDIDPATTARLEDEQVWLNGEQVSVCPMSGRWLRAG